MGYSNGQMQSQSDSGKGGKGEKGDPGLPGIGFNLTDDGNFDLDGKRLTDVANPVDNTDAATKLYVDTKNIQQDNAINSKAEKADVILRDGTQSMKGNLDMEEVINANKKVKHKIIGLANATPDNDAVNLAQLKSYTDSHQNNYHLRESFRSFKNFDDQAELILRNNINVSNHGHHDLLATKKEGSSPGFGSGWAWLRLKITNNLPAGTYTALFEIFSATLLSPTNITFLNRESLIQVPDGDKNYKIITFAHDYRTTHSKEFIQFPSNGRPGKITFQFRFYGPEYNNPGLSFLFYSRVVSGKEGYALDHCLFDVDQVQLRNQMLYFEDINMNDNKIKGLAEPSEDDHAPNRKYVDDEIA